MDKTKKIAVWNKDDLKTSGERKERCLISTVFHSKSLCENTWLIQGEGSNSYLVVGDEYGIMVDSGFATENIQAYAQALTEKPVRMVANTHGHFDHTGGNGWFGRAFMSPKALEIANIPYPSLDASKYSTNYIVTLLGDGDKIELGNRTLEVFDIPAHAPSSVAFLDRKQRILFTGDEVDDCVMLIWMQDEPQPTIEQHIANMEKLLARRDDYDYICAGHNLVMAASSWVQNYRENDRLILSGEKEGEPMVMPSGTPTDFYVPQREYKMQSFYKNTILYYDNRYIHTR